MLLDQVSSAALRADVPLCASASASAWWHSVSAYLHPTFDLTYVCMRIPAAGDTEVPKGNESEGGGISGSATRKGLVSECVYYLTDEEVEYKVHAIQDIREQSHTDKQVVANQASEHRSSVSKDHMIQLSSGTSSEGIQISSRMSAVTCVGNEDAASQDLPLQGTAKVPIFWVQIWLVSSGWSVSYTVCTCT